MNNSNPVSTAIIPPATFLTGLGILLMAPSVADYKILSFRAKLTDNNGVVQYSNIETIAFYNVDGSPVSGTNTSGI